MRYLIIEKIGLNQIETKLKMTGKVLLDLYKKMIKYKCGKNPHFPGAYDQGKKTNVSTIPKMRIPSRSGKDCWTIHP